MFSQEIIDTFWNAFIISGKGMAGIFIFMAIFYFLIVFLENLFPQESENGKDNGSSE